MADGKRFCGNCGAEVKPTALLCTKCNKPLSSAVQGPADVPVSTRGPVGPPTKAENSEGSPTDTAPLRNGKYRYHTEFVSISEKFLGHTHSGSSSKDITDRFNSLAGQGWELVTMSTVPVVGKVFKSNEERTVTLAVWRLET